MKIKLTKRTTEIEADARELRESNTLGDQLNLMLSRCFRSTEPFDDEGDDEEEEEDKVDRAMQEVLKND